MADPAEAPIKPSDILPGLIYVVGEAVNDGQSFPELDIEAKRQLGQLGIFGDSIENAASVATSWEEYRSRSNRARMLDVLDENTGTAMSHQQGEYANARQSDTLGLAMAVAYTSVRAVRRHGVFVADPKNGRRKDGTMGVVDGVVASLVTSYTFADDGDATRFHTMIQGMHNKTPAAHIVVPHSASKGWQPPEDPWDPAWIPPKQTFSANGVFVNTSTEAPTPRPDTVEVTNLTEYDRIVNEAISVRIRKELALIGIALPHEKVPLDEWLQTTTVHPEIEAWLRAIDDTYRKMHETGFVVADYIDDPEGARLKPGRREHIAATDPSAASKVQRDELNDLGHALERRGGDSRHNLEQHPNRHMRYTIERGVHLRRPRPPKAGEPYRGPATARPLNVAERALIEIKETWVAVKENPRRRIPEMLPDLLGGIVGKVLGGAVDIGISASVLLAKGLVSSWKGVRNYGNDLIGWRRQKETARARLDAIHWQLESMQAGITAQRIADQFPDVSLPPSRQLELIQYMTAMMRARLDHGEQQLAE